MTTTMPRPTKVGMVREIKEKNERNQNNEIGYVNTLPSLAKLNMDTLEYIRLQQDLDYSRAYAKRQQDRHEYLRKEIQKEDWYNGTQGEELFAEENHPDNAVGCGALGCCEPAEIDWENLEEETIGYTGPVNYDLLGNLDIDNELRADVENADIDGLIEEINALNALTDPRAFK